jgi:hypothetical protein
LEVYQDTSTGLMLFKNDDERDEFFLVKKPLEMKIAVFWVVAPCTHRRENLKTFRKLETITNLENRCNKPLFVLSVTERQFGSFIIRKARTPLHPELAASNLTSRITRL